MDKNNKNNENLNPKKKKIKAYDLEPKYRKILRITSYAFIFSTLAIFLALLWNYTYFQNRFYLQTRVGGVYIGGMTLSDAKKVLQDSIKNFEDKSLTVEINGKSKDVLVKDFKVKISADQVLENLYKQAHPAYADSFTEFVYSFGKHFVNYDRKLSTETKDSTIQNAIYSNFTDINPYKEPEVTYANGLFTVTEGSAGEALNTESLEYLKLVFAYLNEDPCSLKTVTIEPKLSLGEVMAMADAGNDILTKELKLKAGNIEITERLSNHPEWIIFELSAKTVANALYSKPVFYKFGEGTVAGGATEPVNYNILLNPEEIEKYINENIVNKLENHAENIYLKLDENNKVKVEGVLKDGYALEKDAAVDLITTNFRKGIYENELPISIQKGLIFDETGLNLGIKELVGYGESDFGHSTDNRETNIKVGLSKFQNVIIGPGEIFNYADYIGPVDAAHGFMPGWVIKNKTQNVLEYGGGICQTSTTLFRAAFYGGFPILERHPHGYDVTYYRWPAVGLDASVYVPYASMKFRNDTPGHILIQQDVNTETKRAKVWIYGTNDGRKIEVSGPEIYGKYWSSTYYEIPSTNIATGTRVLSQAAIAGFQTDYFRKVTYTDGRVENYTVHSSYSAVPATYLVGQ